MHGRVWSLWLQMAGTDGGVTQCDVVKSWPQQTKLHVKGYITKCRVNRHLMTWVCCCLDQIRAQAPIKSALQRVIFVGHVLGVLEPVRRKIRSNLSASRTGIGAAPRSRRRPLYPKKLLSSKPAATTYMGKRSCPVGLSKQHDALTQSALNQCF